MACTAFRYHPNNIVAQRELERQEAGRLRRIAEAKPVVATWAKGAGAVQRPPRAGLPSSRDSSCHGTPRSVPSSLVKRRQTRSASPSLTPLQHNTVPSPGPALRPPHRPPAPPGRPVATPRDHIVKQPVVMTDRLPPRRPLPPVARRALSSDAAVYAGRGQKAVPHKEIPRNGRSTPRECWGGHAPVADVLSAAASKLTTSSTADGASCRDEPAPVVSSSPVASSVSATAAVAVDAAGCEVGSSVAENDLSSHAAIQDFLAQAQQRLAAAFAPIGSEAQKDVTAAVAPATSEPQMEAAPAVAPIASEPQTGIAASVTAEDAAAVVTPIPNESNVDACLTDASEDQLEQSANAGNSSTKNQRANDGCVELDKSFTGQGASMSGQLRTEGGNLAKSATDCGDASLSQTARSTSEGDAPTAPASLPSTGDGNGNIDESSEIPSRSVGLSPTADAEASFSQSPHSAASGEKSPSGSLGLSQSRIRRNNSEHSVSSNQASQSAGSASPSRSLGATEVQDDDASMFQSIREDSAQAVGASRVSQTSPSGSLGATGVRDADASMFQSIHEGSAQEVGVCRVGTASSSGSLGVTGARDVDASIIHSIHEDSAQEVGVVSGTPHAEVEGEGAAPQMLTLASTSRSRPGDLGASATYDDDDFEEDEVYEDDLEEESLEA